MNTICPRNWIETIDFNDQIYTLRCEAQFLTAAKYLYIIISKRKKSTLTTDALKWKLLMQARF